VEPAPPGLGLPLALAFGLSGVAGLVYELTWTRYLALLVGHSAFAQVLVLAVYLGGTALGSLLVAERSRKLRQPLWGYALVEALLGVLGLTFHFFYRGAERLLYDTLLPGLPQGDAGGVLIWSIAILLILPQALLLGTTFPLMAAGVVRRRRGAPGRSVADVYLLNTLGGALGVLIGGFVLVPSLGLPGAAATAGALNLAAAALAYRAGRTEQPDAVAVGTTMGLGPAVRASVPLLLAATLFSALASFVYEIGWIRMLSLVLGSATHSFDLMLSAFLFGLGFGSLLIRKRADGVGSPVRLLGAVQWTMGVAALLTIPIYAESFGVMAWLVRTVPRTGDGYILFNLSRYALALIVMLPATLLAGMTLPLITGTLLRAGAGERVIGYAYSANTLGSVIGAVAGGLVLMSRLGLERLLAFGAALDIAVGVGLLVMAAEGARSRMRVGLAAAGLGAVLVGGTVWLVRLDERLLTSGVYRSGQVPLAGQREVLFYADGATATVGAHRLPNGQTVITTNGKGDASLPLRWLSHASGEDLAPFPMSGEGDETTQVLAPLITLAHRPEAKRVLVVGQGSGMSTQILLGDPLIEELVTVEIEPEMIVGSSVFMPANRRSFEDPRARFLLEDARRAVVQGEPLDLILSEPSNPWISGVASLFTVEFYERARNRLVDGGVFGQWVHLYEIEDRLILSILAAIDRTFPEWSAYLTSAADMIIVAGKGSLAQPDWRVAEFPGIQEDLGHAPPIAPGVFESLFLFDHRTMRPLLQRLQPNTDARPLLDTRAERARFLGGGAAGLFSFADHPINLSRIISGARFAPVPYDAPPIIGIAPVERRALAGWLLAAGRSGEPPPFEWWDPAVSGLAAFEAGMAAGPPGDWRQWFEQFNLVEGVLHGRAAGWADTTFYGAVEAYMSAHQAPPAVRESVALLKGLRALDLTSAAAAADALRVTDPAMPQLLPANVLVDAAVGAYLGSGQPAKARAVFDARSPQTGRPADDVRSQVMDALIDAALGTQP
jgi:spermidine synthase